MLRQLTSSPRSRLDHLLALLNRLQHYAYCNLLILLKLHKHHEIPALDVTSNNYAYFYVHI